MGANSCDRTRSSIQDNTCAEYADWEKRKKSAYDIKLAVTIENHTNELYDKRDDFIDIDKATEKISIEIKKHLTKKQYKAFRMLFVENHSEEKVANYLGYKTTEKKRSAGYKQIKNLKKDFSRKGKANLNRKGYFMNELTEEQKNQILQEFEKNPNIIDITKIVF